MDLAQNQLYRFLTACGGNWRNSFTISPVREDSPGCLMAMDRDGRPVFLAPGTLRQAAGEPIDLTECLGQLTEPAFRDLFARYLLWRLPEDAAHIGQFSEYRCDQVIALCRRFTDSPGRRDREAAI